MYQTAIVSLITFFLSYIRTDQCDQDVWNASLTIKHKEDNRFQAKNNDFYITHGARNFYCCIIKNFQNK